MVHATQLEPVVLLEKEPPGFRWEWHLPLGFVSLAAAGTLLVAAGGVQWRVQQAQRHGARTPAKTRMHKVRPHSRPWLQPGIGNGGTERNGRFKVMGSG
ncbi:MAG: hypothetical protein ABR567_17910 [Myxococcales bacterium]